MKKFLKYSAILASALVMHGYHSEAISSQSSTQGLLTTKQFDESMGPLGILANQVVSRDLGWRTVAPFKISDVDSTSRSLPEWLDILGESICGSSIYNPINISKFKEFAIRIGLLPYWMVKSFDSSSCSGPGSVMGSMGSGSKVGTGSGSHCTQNFGNWDAYYSKLGNRLHTRYLDNRLKMGSLADSHDLFPAFYFRGDNFEGVDPVKELRSDGFIAYHPHAGIYSAPILRYEMEKITQLPKSTGYINAPLMIRELERLMIECGYSPDAVKYRKEHPVKGEEISGEGDFLLAHSGKIGEGEKDQKILVPKGPSQETLTSISNIFTGLISEARKALRTAPVVTQTGLAQEMEELDRLEQK